MGYACGAYIALLEQHGIQSSMSRAGCPYENAMVESFTKTLKQEEVDGRACRDLADAKASIGSFLAQVYNRQRLHSALGYLAPTAFEAITPSSGAAQPRMMATTGCPRFRVSAPGCSPNPWSD